MPPFATVLYGRRHRRGAQLRARVVGQPARRCRRSTSPGRAGRDGDRERRAEARRDRSERDVVVHVVEAGDDFAAGRFGRAPAARGAARRRRALATAASRCRRRRRRRHPCLRGCRASASPGDDLGGVLLDAVLVGPLARLQAPFDVDRAALLQVLAGDLGELVVEDDAVPLGLLDLLAGGPCPSSCARWRSRRCRRRCRWACSEPRGRGRGCRR